MKPPINTPIRNLSGQVALITGAGRGIGSSLAHHLAAEGIHLVLAARTTSQLESLKAQINEKYPDVRVLTVSCDVSIPSQAQKLVESTHQEFQRLDILINNAGVAGKIALLHEISIEEIDRTIDINLKGPIYLMKYALPGMIERQAGTIININSVAGKVAFPYWSIYDASKFGLHAVTVAVGEEQAPNNIKVVGIYPGAVNTPIWDTIELNHEPNLEGMLDPETVAESVLYVLHQPGKVYIPEITLKPLQPAL
jgi:short-subunit dehydrogenase